MFVQCVFQNEGSPLYVELLAIVDKYVAGDFSSFANSCLRGLDLSRTVIEDVDFSGSDMRHAHFYFAYVRRTKFAGARLDDADFGLARLQNVDFTSADLRGANFRLASLWECTWTDSFCSPSTWTRARVHSCSFRRSMCVGASFFGAVYDHCDFTAANLSGVDLEGAEGLGTCTFAQAQVNCHTLWTNTEFAVLGGWVFVFLVAALFLIVLVTTGTSSYEYGVLICAGLEASLIFAIVYVCIYCPRNRTDNWAARWCIVPCKTRRLRNVLLSII